MKNMFLTIVAALAVNLSAHAANLATDNASNYSGSWTTGSNGGSGFGAWTITSSGGTGGFAGAIITNPSNGGITGMANPSFGLYANGATGAFVDVSRGFTGGGLNVGDIFTFQWGINFDSGAGGNKGFSLLSSSNAELININNGGTQDITLNGSNVGFGYGVAMMTWSIERTSSTNLRVTANDRDGNGQLSTDVTIAAVDSPAAFKFYASNLSNGDNGQPYIGALTVTVPEPSSSLLMGLGLAGLAALRRARKTA